MERISILCSILFISYLSWSIFKKNTLAFKFIGTLVLFVSTVALSGFVSGSLGMGVNGNSVFFGALIFLILGKILVVLDSKKFTAQNVNALGELPVFNQVRDKSSWIFLCALLGWAVLNLHLASWQIIPQSLSVDSAAHYSLVRYLYENKHLPDSDWSFLWEIAHYPFGFHLTTVIIANLFGVDPFYVIWIFTALLMGVVVASVCTMIYSDLRSRQHMAVAATLWAFAMFVVSPYIIESYSRSGFYPMVLGLVYIVMFIWCLRSFAEITRGKVFFVSIVLAGMGLTYPQWLPILVLIYAYLVYTKVNASGASRMLVLLIPITISVAIGVNFALLNWEGLRYIYNIEGGVVQDLSYLVLLLAGSALLILLVSFKKLTRDYFFVLLFVILQIGLVVASKKMVGLGGMYAIYKYAYILTPIFILLISQGYFFNKGEGVREKFGVAIPIVVLLGTFSSFSFHDGFHSGFQNFRSALNKYSPAIRENEFHALEWVRKNIVNDQVTYVGDAPFPLFGYAITGKVQAKGEFGWWVLPSLQFESWKLQAGSGEIAVRPHVQESVGEQNSGGDFQVLYKEGDCVVVKKI